MHKELKLMCIFGTRPEAIKMAPLIKEIEKTNGLKVIVCVTAQHREMLDQVLESFNIVPDFDLNIMKANQTLAELTSRILEKLTQILKEVKPNMVLVHGDTTTTFVSALASFYEKIPIGHIEAGLRTYNMYEPFPEEANRKIVSVISTINFAPTINAKNNLFKEGVNKENIYVTGNTVIDVLRETVKENYVFKQELLNRINYNNKIITITAHRRENQGKPLINICNAIKAIVHKYSDVEVIYAVHLNPKVREIVIDLLGNIDRVHLIEPPDMNDMHNLMKKSYIIMTDSGGIQEEAPSLNKPVLVLRNVTERPEGVEAGTLKLVGTNIENICNSVDELISNKKVYDNMMRAKNPFGDGKASIRIVEAIMYYFNLKQHKPEDYL